MVVKAAYFCSSWLTKEFEPHTDMKMDFVVTIAVKRQSRKSKVQILCAQNTFEGSNYYGCTIYSEYNLNATSVTLFISHRAV